MTEPQTAPNVLAFSTDVNRNITDADRFRFTIDDAEYTLIRPKQAVLVAIVASSEHLSVSDGDNLSADDIRQIDNVVQMVVSNIEQPGRNRIRRRLADPNDGLDLIQFLPMAQDLVAALSPRPTIAQPGSS